MLVHVVFAVIASALLAYGSEQTPPTDQDMPRLLTASQRGDTQEVQRLLDSGADVNATHRGFTALHHATGEPGVARLLIAAGANVNAQTPEGQTPLLAAVRRMDPDLVNLLIDAGADVNKRGKNGAVPLVLWVVNTSTSHQDKDWRVAVTRKFIEAGADINARGEYGSLPLGSAAMFGDTDVMQVLIDASASVDAPGFGDRTALVDAASSWGEGQTRAVQLLLASGADPNLAVQKSPNRWTRRQGLARDWDIVPSVEMKSSVPVINRKTPPGKYLRIFSDMGLTPFLAVARSSGHPDSVKRARFLLDAGADPMTRNLLGQTALMFVAARGDTAMARLALDAGNDPNAKDIDGRTALMGSVWGGHERASELLLEVGADPNLRDAEGKSALIFAATQWDVDHAHLLLRSGAEIGDVKNRTIGNLLAVAANRGHIELVQMMLSAGVDPNARSTFWRDRPTALMESIRGGRKEITKLLLEAGGDPNLRDKSGGNSLMYAIYYDDGVSQIRAVLNAGVDVNAETISGVTPLSFAAKRRGRRVLQMLLDAGADPYQKNHHGRTAWSFVKEKDRDILEPYKKREVRYSPDK